MQCGLLIVHLSQKPRLEYAHRLSGQKKHHHWSAGAGRGGAGRGGAGRGGAGRGRAGQGRDLSMDELPPYGSVQHSLRLGRLTSNSRSYHKIPLLLEIFLIIENIVCSLFILSQEQL